MNEITFNRIATVATYTVGAAFWAFIIFKFAF